MKRLFFVAVLSLLLLSVNKSYSYDKIYIVIDGIPGECVDVGHVNEVEAWAFNFEITLPIDATTGSSRGKRSFGPVTITKKIDKASVKLIDTHLKGSKIRSVVLKFYKTGITPDQLYYKITLYEVLISKLKQYKNLESPWPGNTNPDLEEVSMTFNKIDIENPRDGSKTSDDWKAKK